MLHLHPFRASLLAGARSTAALLGGTRGPPLVAAAVSSSTGDAPVAVRRLVCQLASLHTPRPSFQAPDAPPPQLSRSLLNHPSHPQLNGLSPAHRSCPALLRLRNQQRRTWAAEPAPSDLPRARASSMGTTFCASGQAGAVSEPSGNAAMPSSPPPPIVTDPAEASLRRRKEVGGEWFKVSDSCSLVLLRGDITTWSVDGKTDAIANAANEGLLGGSGVDGAIHRAAGPELFKACYDMPVLYKWVRCPAGSAVITKGYQLPVSRVIHAVGPIYENDETSAPLLEKVYKTSLSLAIKDGIKYLAFPAISCGIYGYPHAKAAEVALRIVKENSSGLVEVHFVLFEESTWTQWFSKAKECFEAISD